MRVGEDNWCPQCGVWMYYNNKGNCIKCGTHIDTKSKQYSWFEKFGVDPKELQNMDF